MLCGCHGTKRRGIFARTAERSEKARVTMPQIVVTIDHIVCHGDYLYNPSENTVLVVYGGLVKDAAVNGSDNPLNIAKQLLRELVASRQTKLSLDCSLLTHRHTG
jgi:hypothetical protein